MKKTILSQLLLVLLVALASCTDPLQEVEEHVSVQEAYTEEESNNTSRVTDYLDYGLHWFNAQGTPTKAYDEKTGKVISVSSSYYNPSKPTVIYFHGWQQGTSSQNYKRNDFNMVNKDNGQQINAMAQWKAQGWNVAIFYWNQFADEDEVKDAEAKIWSASGPRNMRYRLSDGSYSTSQSPGQSVSQLAFEQYKAVFSNHNNSDFRFAGHSLGNQLATAVAMKISNATRNGSMSSSLMPNRLELLDPFWSKGDKSFLNNEWTGERVRNNISTMISRHNLAVTWYKSTLILTVGVGDGNNALKDIVALQSMRPWYLDSWQVVDKHVYIWKHYFWSYGFSAPKEVTINFWGRRKGTGNVAASASTSTSRIRQMMGDSHVWDQVEGRYTATPSDDQFERKNW